MARRDTNPEKLITEELPAAVNEFLSRLPDGFRVQRRRCWIRWIAVLAVLAGLGALVAAVAQVPSWQPEPHDDGGE